MLQEPIDYKAKLLNEFGVTRESKGAQPPEASGLAREKDNGQTEAEAEYWAIQNNLSQLKLLLLECLGINEAEIVELSDDNKAQFKTWLSESPLVQYKTLTRTYEIYKKHYEKMQVSTTKQEEVLYRIAESGFMTTLYKLITKNSLDIALRVAMSCADQATFSLLCTVAREKFPGNLEVLMSLQKISSTAIDRGFQVGTQRFVKAAYEEKVTETLIEQILMNPYNSFISPQEHFWAIIRLFYRNEHPIACLKQEALYQFVQKEVGKFVSSPDLKIQKLKHFREVFRVVMVGSIFNDGILLCSPGSYRNDSCRKIDEWIKILELGQTAPLPLNEHVGTHSTVFFGYAKDYKVGTVAQPAKYEDEQAQTKTLDLYRI